jgi:hypothetical protein
MRLFSWAHMAFRSAIRAEVDRAMEDRRRAFAIAAPIDDAEVARIRNFLAASGVKTRAHPRHLPLPANDHHSPHPAA